MTYCLQFLSRHVYADFRRPSTEMTRLSSSVDFIVRERKEKAVYLGNKFDITGVWPFVHASPQTEHVVWETRYNQRIGGNEAKVINQVYDSLLSPWLLRSYPLSLHHAYSDFLDAGRAVEYTGSLTRLFGFRASPFQSRTQISYASSLNQTASPSRSTVSSSSISRVVFDGLVSVQSVVVGTKYILWRVLVLYVCVATRRVSFSHLG